MTHDNIKNELEIIYGYTPAYKDHCEHGRECFVGCFTEGNFHSPTGGLTDYDLYIYPDTTFGGVAICIRYGDSPEEYMGGYSLSHFAFAAFGQKGNPVHRRAFDMLLERGFFTWTRREDKNE